MVIKRFVLFLTDNPGAFAWSFLTSLVSGSVASDLGFVSHFSLGFSL